MDNSSETITMRRWIYLTRAELQRLQQLAAICGLSLDRYCTAAVAAAVADAWLFAPPPKPAKPRYVPTGRPRGRPRKDSGVKGLAALPAEPPGDPPNGG